MGFDYRIYTGLWKQTLGGHKQNLCHQDPGERSSNPTETAADLPVNVQESLAEVCARDLLKEVAIMVITST